MLGRQTKAHRKPSSREGGVVITLVAVFMLFVVGAMAALSVDVVTLYAARSEAQLVADAAALAAARVLANSGATSDSTGNLMTLAEPIATRVGNLVATQSQVGGRTLIPGTPGACTGAEICVTINAPAPYTNPHVTVTVQRSDLPTFFARIWGTTKVAIAASATAEAYNPSGGAGTSNTTSLPVAPLCVKPWLVPNLDPSTGTGTAIFDSSNNIVNPNLLGWTSTAGSQAAPGTPVPLSFGCNSSPNNPCTPPMTLQAWNYLPGADDTFTHPTSGLPSCSPALASNYQYSVGGCVPVPISCSQTANIDTTSFPATDWNTDTSNAANCITRATVAGGGDSVSSSPPTEPFYFAMGSNDPVLVAGSLTNADAMVSDSLVTVPIFDTTAYSGTANVSIIGFVQLFLNPAGNPSPEPPNTEGQINTTVVNLAGCRGISAGAQPIIGNGAGPVAVRLISPP